MTTGWPLGYCDIKTGQCHQAEARGQAAKHEQLAPRDLACVTGPHCRAAGCCHEYAKLRTSKSLCSVTRMLRSRLAW